VSEEYDPLRHSVVQACSGAWSKFECDDFVEALFESILSEIKRVHWNVYQHQWEATWHGDEVEDPEIPGISFVRFYADRCDCGGQAPIHPNACDISRLFQEWNRRRLDAISDPVDGPFPGVRSFSFDPARETAFEAKVPRPKCTCGASDAWDEDRGCLPTCIGQRPNFQHEDVEIRWYKWPGRGMSTNKDWTPTEWRDWFNRCLKMVRAFDVEISGNREREQALRKAFSERYPKVRP